MSLSTRIQLGNEYYTEFDLSQGVDLSDAYYSGAPTVNVFGMSRETKRNVYSLEKTPVNVDELTICCHNNRTHTESTNHVYKDGLNVSDIPKSAAFRGCLLISVKPIPVIESEDKYDGGAELDKYNDLIVTKAMIEEKMSRILVRCPSNLPAFFKQCVFVRIEGDFQKHTNWPFLSNDAMQYLHDNISDIFGINLCSVDREESPKVPNHRIWFGHDPKSTRLICEGLSIPPHISDGIYTVNYQLAPIANTDAVPTRPIVYPCSLKKLHKL